MLAAQSLAVGSTEVMVAGGMESMSNVPYYLPRSVHTVVAMCMYNENYYQGTRHFSILLTSVLHTIVSGGFVMVTHTRHNVCLYRARAGFGYGHQTVEDGIIKDGLWDVYNQVRAPMCTHTHTHTHTLPLVPHGHVWRGHS